MSRLTRNSWSPDATDDVSIANVRVCLALLRMHRNLPPMVQESDEDLIWPFWPVLRLEAARFREALRASLPTATLRRRRGRRAVPASAAETEAPDWPAELLDGAVELPLAVPGQDVRVALSEGLVNDEPAFRALFNAIQTRLERACARRAMRSDKNLDMLAALLGLNAAQAGVLRLSHAIEVSSIGSSAFISIQRPARQLSALRHALDLPNDEPLRDALSRRGALMRSGLMHVERHDSAPDLEDALRLSRRGSALLNAAVGCVEDMAALVLKPLPARDASRPLQWPHLLARTRLLESTLVRAMATGACGINVLLYGAPGTGKSEYAAQLIASTGGTGFSILDTDEHADSASRAERLASLHLSQLFAPAARSVLLLDEAEDIFDNDYNSAFARMFGGTRESKSWMNGLLESNTHPVIWISNQIAHIDPAHLRRFTYCLEFPATPRGLRRDIARHYLEPLHCSEPLIDSVSAHAQVSPALLASAARFAAIACDPAQPGGEQVDQAVRHMITDSLKAMGVQPLGGVPARVTRFDTRYLQVEGSIQPEAIISGLNRRGRGTLLLSGPPGTGKTQLAAEIALRLGRELVYRTASDINTMWFGESERNVAKMFMDCDTAQEILFLDEADTLLASREGGHRPDVAVAAEFLRRVEAFDGVFICATNHRVQLDAAMMRRFSFRLEFNPLDATQRRELLCETVLGWRPEAGEPLPVLAPALLARLDRLDQLTPGDFANVAKRLQALDVALDAEGWVNQLCTEHNTKPHATKGALGFM